jgi:hypothetical protein
MDMRAIVCSLIVGLFPGIALAETIEYTFTGNVDDEAAAGIPTFWNGPGPQPSNFVMTFDVDTLSPLNSVSYTFGPSSAGPSINSITANLVATNFTLSLDGTTVLQSPTGGFAFSGSLLGEFSFIGGGAGGGTDLAGFSFVPDFGLGATTQAELMGSSDPLGLLLNNSGFHTDSGDPSLFTFEDSRLGALISGTGKAISVSEPNTLVLLVLAGLSLGFVHRRRALGVMRICPDASLALLA